MNSSLSLVRSDVDRQRQNQGIADTLKFCELSDAFRHFPEPIRGQLAATFVFNESHIPEHLSVQVIDPKEPCPASQALAA